MGVQVNGYWTWQTVHAAGGVHTQLPYDCHAGLANWHIGWSAPKKAGVVSLDLCPHCQTWCCSNQHLGCGGGGAAGAAGSIT